MIQSVPRDGSLGYLPKQHVSRPSRFRPSLRRLPAAPPPTAVRRHCAVLLIGCEYTQYAAQGTMPRLPGCHMDIKLVQKMLMEHYGYQAADFTVLSDESPTYLQPTRANIVAQLQRLIDIGKGNPDCRLVLYYSGHGTQTRDQSGGDELDGLDEAIVPCDYLTEGLLVDDTFHDQFWSQLPLSVRVTCIFDCCNSGTVFDLPYRYESKNQTVPCPSATPTKLTTPLPWIVTLSGCRDNQTSASAQYLEKNIKWEGALSYVLRETLKDHHYQAVGLDQLIETMRSKLKSLGFAQIPQLGFSRDIKPSSVTDLFSHGRAT